MGFSVLLNLSDHGMSSVGRLSYDLLHIRKHWDITKSQHETMLAICKFAAGDVALRIEAMWIL